MTERMLRAVAEPAHRHPRALHRADPGRAGADRSRPSTPRPSSRRAPRPARRWRSTRARSASTRPRSCWPWPSARVPARHRHRRPRAGPARVAAQRMRAGRRGGRAGRAGHERPTGRRLPGLDGRPRRLERRTIRRGTISPVSLPVAPPGVPDAGQAGPGAPRGGRSVLRAQMGRVSLHRLPGRRRGRARQPQREAAHPVLPRAGRRRYAPQLPERCVVDGEIVIAGPGGLDFDRSRSGSIRPRPGSGCWPRRTPASFVAFDLLALGDDDLHGRAVRRRGDGRSKRRSPDAARRST